VIRFWRKRVVGRVIGTSTAEDGTWQLRVQITDRRLWSRITGEYRPWRLRVVNLVRRLLRLQPIPYPRRGPGMRGFSMGTTVEGVAELRERFNRHDPRPAPDGPRCPPEACRVPEAMIERLKPKKGR
jgi:hypothetical protein